jgi:hypothetical protein
LISSLFASSALISNVAHAETQSVNQNPKVIVQRVNEN